MQSMTLEQLRATANAGGVTGVTFWDPEQKNMSYHDTGEERVVLEPSDPGIITAVAMADLVRWYNAILPDHPWTVLVATEFVFRFLAIHPFQDGNGRLGRALFILALIKPHRKPAFRSSTSSRLPVCRAVLRNMRSKV